MKACKRYLIIVVLMIILPHGESDESDVSKRTTQVTKRANKLLLRKRRYLTFPMGSNFIMTMSVVKSLMIKAPAGLRLAGECDVPFTLPSDTRPFPGRKDNHQRQRREIFEQISYAINGIGHNGTACVKRAVCDFRSYTHLKGSSLVKDLLMAVFKFDEPDEYLMECNENLRVACKFPLFNYFQGLTGRASD